MAIVYFSNNNASGSGSLQNAISSASANDVIVPSADFTDFEILIEGSLTIDKNLTLDAQKHRIRLKPTRNNVLIATFNSGEQYVSVIVKENVNVTFRNFIFEDLIDVVSEATTFVYFEGSNEATFTNCRFNGCDYPVYCPITATFNNCVFIDFGRMYLIGTFNFCTFRGQGNLYETSYEYATNYCILNEDAPWLIDDTLYLDPSAYGFNGDWLGATPIQGCECDYDGNVRVQGGAYGAFELLDNNVEGTTKLFYQKPTYACKNAYIGNSPGNQAWFAAVQYNNNYLIKWDLSSLFENPSLYRCKLELYDPTTGFDFEEGKDTAAQWLLSGSDLSVTNLEGSSHIFSLLDLSGSSIYYSRLGYYPANDPANITYFIITYTYSGDLPNGYSIIYPPQLFNEKTYWTYDREGTRSISSFPHNGLIQYYVLDDVRFLDSMTLLNSDSETLYVGGNKTVVFGGGESSTFQNRRCNLIVGEYSELGLDEQSYGSAECSNLTLANNGKIYYDVYRTISVPHADSCSSTSRIKKGVFGGCYKIPQNVRFDSLVVNRTAISNYDSEQNAHIYADELVFEDVGDNSEYKIDCASGIKFHCDTCEIQDSNENGGWFENPPTILPKTSVTASTTENADFIVDLSDATDEVNLTLGGQVVKNNDEGASITGSATVENEDTDLELWTLTDNSKLIIDDCNVASLSYTIPTTTTIKVVDGTLHITETLTINGTLEIDGQSNKINTASGDGTVSFLTDDSILTIYGTCSLTKNQFEVETNAVGYLGVPISQNKTALQKEDLVVGGIGAHVQSFSSKQGAATIEKFDPLQNSTVVVEKITSNSKEVVLTNVSEDSFDLTPYLTTTPTTFRVFDGECLKRTTDRLKILQKFFSVDSQASNKNQGTVLTSFHFPHGSFPKVGQNFSLMASVYKDEQRTVPVLAAMNIANPQITYSIYKYVNTSQGRVRTPVQGFSQKTSYVALFNKYKLNKYWKADKKGYNVFVAPETSPFNEKGTYEIEVTITFADSSVISFTREIKVLS